MCTPVLSGVISFCSPRPAAPPLTSSLSDSPTSPGRSPHGIVSLILLSARNVLSPQICVAQALACFRSSSSKRKDLKPCSCSLALHLALHVPTLCCIIPQHYPKLTHLRSIYFCVPPPRAVGFVYCRIPIPRNGVQKAINKYLWNECLLAHDAERILIKLRHFKLNEASPLSA